MKNFLAILSVFFVLLLVISCTKEKLIVVEKSSKVFYNDPQDIGQAD